MVIEIGDKLKIRSWEDMAEEFGVDNDGNIDSQVQFLAEMKSLCGKDFTVFSGTSLLHSTEGFEGSYKITSDMLERR